MRGRLIPRTAAGVVAAGTIGAILTLAGVRSPATGPLTFVFLLTAPGLAIAALLTALDPSARAVVAGVSALVLDAAVAEVMLVTSTWSPRGGTAAVSAASGVLAVVAWARRRRCADAVNGYMPGATASDDDDESWAFDA